MIQATQCVQYQFALQIHPIPLGGTVPACSLLVLREAEASAVLLRGGRPIARSGAEVRRPADAGGQRAERSPRIVLRMFHPAGGENSGASLAGSVMRNGITHHVLGYRKDTG